LQPLPLPRHAAVARRPGRARHPLQRMRHPLRRKQAATGVPAVHCS
jgi:hypothetical protein